MPYLLVLIEIRLERRLISICFFHIHMIIYCLSCIAYEAIACNRPSVGALNLIGLKIIVGSIKTHV